MKRFQLALRPLKRGVLQVVDACCMHDLDTVLLRLGLRLL